MIIDDINFDIDNVDIEEQMIIQDIEEEIQEEQNIEEFEKEEEEKKLQIEAEKSYKQSRRILNSKNLDYDLAIEAENLRPRYTWSSDKDGEIYEGVVVHKIGSNDYIFNCSVKDENLYKLKKFNLNNISQIKK